uniref:Dynein light chain n=1 Tax=Oncorhynchus tshawytscha TaxID=74940 RepID=A0AAZ3PU76_ONCTS
MRNGVANRRYVRSGSVSYTPTLLSVNHYLEGVVAVKPSVHTAETTGVGLIRATMSDRKAVIKNADMSEEMQQDAVECATQALEKYNIEKDIAAYIKKEFDKKYNPTWHCIVGRNFGSYVTHETKHFIYFYLGQVAILLFKSG